MQNMRTRESEQEFFRWLLELGNGTLTAPSMPGVIEIPVTCAVSFNREEVYGDMSGTEDVSDRVIFYPPMTIAYR